RLKRLLVFHTKALLLVDDDEAQVFEAHLTREDAVGADNKVDCAVGEALDNLLGLRVRLEARERNHLDREGAKAIAERVEMLLYQERRWAQDRHLRAVLNRLERGTYGDLRFAEANIATDEPVH